MNKVLKFLTFSLEDLCINYFDFLVYSSIYVSFFVVDVFENAVNRGVRNISFGDLSGNLGRTMYGVCF